MEKRKPDVLIIMPDQLRADCVGAYGNKVIKTPNIDKIAEQGVLFRNAFTTSPVCMPARASFVSGVYPHNHHMWTNEGSLPADDETFFRHLQENGWFVAYVGKSHFYEHRSFHMKTMEGYMKKRGIDYVHETTGPHSTVHTDSYMTDYLKEKGLLDAFRDDYKKRTMFSTHPSPLPEESYLDSYVGKKTVEFIKNYSQDKPLCLFVGFPGPHEPWDPPGKYAEMYSTKDMPDEIKDDKMPVWLSEKVKSRMQREREYFRELTSEKIKEIRAMYYGKVSIIDYWVGEIIEEYGKKRNPENLVIVFWSDHGDMLGDHGILHKVVFYESSIKVPLIIKWPGKNDTIKNSANIVEIIDVFPTLLAGLDVSPSERAAGENLFEEKKQNFALSEIYAYDCYNYMIRTDKFKYSINEKGDGVYLFALDNDPLERKNLLGNREFAEAEQKLRETLLKKLLNSQFQDRQLPFNHRQG